MGYNTWNNTKYNDSSFLIEHGKVNTNFFKMERISPLKIGALYCNTLERPNLKLSMVEGKKIHTWYIYLKMNAAHKKKSMISLHN